MRYLKRWLAYLLMALVVAFGVLFSVQNTALVPLDLLIIQLPEQRVALWVLLAFAIGGVTGMLISSSAILQLKSQSLLLQRKLDKHHKELTKLRGPALRSPQP